MCHVPSTSQFLHYSLLVADMTHRCDTLQFGVFKKRNNMLVFLLSSNVWQSEHSSLVWAFYSTPSKKKKGTLKSCFPAVYAVGYTSCHDSTPRRCFFIFLDWQELLCPWLGLQLSGWQWRRQSWACAASWRETFVEIKIVCFDFLLKPLLFMNQRIPAALSAAAAVISTSDPAEFVAFCRIVWRGLLRASESTEHFDFRGEVVKWD